MKSYKNLYPEIISLKNLIFAYKKARKGKTKKEYVKRFEEDLAYNLKILHEELKTKIYFPKPLETFILKDPKTRRISKSEFRDRIVHHAICNILEPLFDKTFIYDNCANRKCKGNLFAIKRLELFQRKVSGNGFILKNDFEDSNYVSGFCLKADIKHYFREIERTILLKIISRKVNCKNTLNLIKKILYNFEGSKGMPLGNLTSQFFANIYLNELDQFVKHKLKAKYYVRYVDDFILLHSSKEQLKKWKREIELFLNEKLKLKLHPDKSKILSLSKGVDFVGFREFYYFKLLRKRNIRCMKFKIKEFTQDRRCKNKFNKSWQGWKAYSDWSNNYWLKEKLLKRISPT